MPVGSVLAYEPPARLLISWDVSLQWQLETDVDKTSEVEVRFFSETTGRTRVELEHRNIDRLGDGWEQMHGAVGSPDGWDSGSAAVRGAGRSIAGPEREYNTSIP